MKKLLKILGIIVAALVLILAAVAAWINFSAPPTYEVQNLEVKIPTDSVALANGKKIVESICSYCHKSDDGTLNGKLFSPESEGLGELWAANITKHPEALGRYSDGEIAYLLRTGVKRDGKLAGPFMMFPNLSDDDMGAIIAYLRSDAPLVQASDVKRQSHYSFLAKALFKLGAFKPLPYEHKPFPSIDPANKVAYGYYLTNVRFKCSECHSASFETIDPLVPEKSAGFCGGGNPIADHHGAVVKSANITPHPEEGIGKWSEEQFQKTVLTGITPFGKELSPLMPRFTVLDSTELSAIYAYLRTIPALETPKPEEK